MPEEPLQPTETVEPVPTFTQIEEVVEPTAQPESVPGKTSETPKEGSEPEKSKIVKETIRLRRRAQTAEEEAIYWKEKALGKESSASPKPTVESAPTIENFESYDEYLVAKAKYEIRQDQARDSQQQILQELDQKFNANLERAAQMDLGILELVQDPSLPISQAMSLVIKDSEVPSQLLRWLDQHRMEAKRIYGLHPLAAARELGKVEAQLVARAPEKINKISQAPEPVSSLPPKGSPLVNEDDLSTEEWVRRRNAKQYGRKT